jgi:hypothetical protein
MKIKSVVDIFNDFSLNSPNNIPLITFTMKIQDQNKAIMFLKMTLQIYSIFAQKSCLSSPESDFLRNRIENGYSTSFPSAWEKYRLDSLRYVHFVPHSLETVGLEIQTYPNCLSWMFRFRLFFTDFVHTIGCFVPLPGFRITWSDLRAASCLSILSVIGPCRMNSYFKKEHLLRPVYNPLQDIADLIWGRQQHFPSNGFISNSGIIMRTAGSKRDLMLNIPFCVI